MKTYKIKFIEDFYLNDKIVNSSNHSIECNNTEPFDERVTEFEKLVDNAEHNDDVNGYELMVGDDTATLLLRNGNSTLVRGVGWEEIEV